MHELNKLKFTFYSDPGHGWLEVSRDFLDKLGITDEITPCSYQDNFGYVYLEEDCDYATFVDAMKEKGIEFEIREVSNNNESRIRKFKCFTK